jgi:hypothetical protein
MEGSAGFPAAELIFTLHLARLFLLARGVVMLDDGAGHRRTPLYHDAT